MDMILENFQQLFNLHPILCAIMGLAFLGFFISFFIAISSYENHRSSNTLKFAPSVMTSLGLLGTFISLISSLNGLGGSIDGDNQLNMAGIAGFMTSLEKVFYFSAMGIFSAIVFLFLNVLVTQKNSKKNREEKIDIVQTNTDYNASSNEELKAQSQYLRLMGISTQQQIDELGKVNKSMVMVGKTLQGMQQGYDAHLLGEIISVKLSETMQPLFGSLINSLQYNQNNSIQKLLNELKTDILIPIKDEIAKTTNATNQVVGAIQENQKINLDLIKKLNEMTTSMDSFVEKTQTLAEGMYKTIEELKTFQTNQNTTLRQFNQDLSNNLNKIEPAIINGIKTAETALVKSIDTASSNMNKTLNDTTQKMESTLTTATATMGTTITALNGTMLITIDGMKEVQQEQKETLTQFNQNLANTLNTIEPAIKDGMSFATQEMTGAINSVTDKMNVAMTSVVSDISNKVVNELSGILTQFDTSFSGHLDRMNSELEKTGTNAKELIDRSATALENTLGNINTTLEQSSEKLQKELEAFRNEYEVSLTTFFTKQNEQLEKTLGVQAQALQDTANQLKTQFEEMSKQQIDINGKSKTLLDNFRPTYDSLLNQMATIAQTLHSGQHQLIKDLKHLQEHTQTINQELKNLGDTMPKEFTQAFDLLNQMYVKKFNESNAMLEKAMQEMTVAAAALITTSNLNTSADD